MKRVFISKEIEECAIVLNNSYPEEYQFTFQSFINFEPVDFVLNDAYEVILFSSKRSAHFFLEKEQINSQSQVACVGLSTAEYLNGKGVKVDFVPVSSDINLAAEQFKQWVCDKKVFAPISNRSLRTFLNVLEADQIVEEVVYKTSTIDIELRTCDIYFFSSPSNVEGFLKSNEIPIDAKVYAWGSSTKEALKKAGIHSSSLECPNLQQVVRVLKGV